jgi:hypothetical protein
MNDKITELMARALCGTVNDPKADVWEQFVDDAQLVIEALNSTGLAILPLEATEDMLDETRYHDHNVPKQVWHDMAPAFDPSTWEPRNDRKVSR